MFFISFFEIIKILQSQHSQIYNTADRFINFYYLYYVYVLKYFVKINLHDKIN
jgi:hypothetical protein